MGFRRWILLAVLLSWNAAGTEAAEAGRLSEEVWRYDAVGEREATLSATGRAPAGLSGATSHERPDDSLDAVAGRFEKVVLTEQVSYPMELGVAEDGLVYEPVNLANIEALRLKVKPETGGVLEVRLDGPDGPTIAEVPVGTAEDAATAVAAPGVEVTGLDQGEIVGQLPEDLQAAYMGWQRVSVPVDDPGGTHALHVVVRGEEEGVLMQLDYLEFEGEGVAMKRPR